MKETHRERRNRLGRLHAILNLVKDDYDVNAVEIEGRFVINIEHEMSIEWEIGRDSVDNVYDVLARLPYIVAPRKIPIRTPRDFQGKDIEFGLKEINSRRFWFQVKSSKVGITKFLEGAMRKYGYTDTEEARKGLAQMGLVVLNGDKPSRVLEKEIKHWCDILKALHS